MPQSGFAHDDDGLLYHPELRRSMTGTIADDQRAAAEALLALRHAAFALDQFTRALRNRYDIRDIRMGVLVRLHNHRAGVMVADLASDLGEDVIDVLDHIEEAGMLTKVAGSAPAVRLTDAGAEFMDDVMRRLATDLSTLTEGVDPAQLATMRHVCLRLVENRGRTAAANGSDAS